MNKITFERTEEKCWDNDDIYDYEINFTTEDGTNISGLLCCNYWTYTDAVNGIENYKLKSTNLEEAKNEIENIVLSMVETGNYLNNHDSLVSFSMGIDKNNREFIEFQNTRYYKEQK